MLTQWLQAEAARRLEEELRSKQRRNTEDEPMGASGGGPASPIFTVDGITFSLDPALPSPSFTFLPPTHMTSEALADTIKVQSYCG
jgi:hypothetical protein